MTSPVWLFLYSPLPFWAISTFIAYRHDLTRLIHPMQEHGSLKTWWSVCGYLGLVDRAVVPEPSARRETVRYIALLLASAAVSLSWMLRAFPLVWYYLLLSQAVSGLILFGATFRYLGPLPSRPYTDALPYPRIGSRIRHLAKVPKTGIYRPARTSEPQETEAGSFAPRMRKVRQDEENEVLSR